MLRRALLAGPLALLAFGGAASAKLAAEPPASPVSTAATTTAAATTTTTAAPAGATETVASTALVVSGHGWGHGIGMSQWGAYGYALHGFDYRRILAHYYPGTTVGAAASPIVRVLLLSGKTRVTLASGSPWKLVDGSGAKVALPPGSLAVGPSLVVSGRKLSSPLTFSPGATPLRVGKLAYRGRLLVVSNGKRLQVVDALPLESYVLGVVGGEMPSNWPPAALEAQAVAARSYALSELENVVTARAFDLYGDTRDQAYGGIAAESSAVTAAVRATAHRVVLYGGKVARTYFSSSSGGRTVSAAEAFGKDVPYLESVPDPYDTYSPYHDWGPVLLDAGKAARALKVPGALLGLTLEPGPSGHVERVDAVGASGSVELTGADVRTALGLRSTWFSVGWLALSPPADPVAFGSAGTLTGTARGVDGVTLEEKRPGAGWETVTALSPGSDGTFSVGVRPEGTTEYRLAVGQLRAAVVTVTVAPLVSASVAAGSVEGTVQPPLSGASVQLQRQDGGAWRTVASARTDASGAFAVAAPTAPGAYRVRCTPGHGLSPGVSQPIQT